MTRKLRLLLACLLTFGWLSFIPAAYASGGLSASVYDVLGQNASPTLPNGLQPTIITSVPNINFNWGSGSVLGGPSEDVIVIFSGYITSDVTKDIKLSSPADDGTILYLDGNLITSDWVDKGGGGSTSNPVHFDANVSKQITLWYYENGGGANVKLLWDKTGTMDVVSPEAFSITAVSPPPPPPPPPAPLNNPTALSGSVVQDKINLIWTAPEATTTSVERYAIFWSYDNFQSGWGIATGNVGDANALNTYAVINNLPDSTTVYVKVRADNDSLGIYSGWSDTIQLTTGTYKADLAAAQIEIQAELQRQSNASASVLLYENLVISSLNDIETATVFKNNAQQLVNLVKNNDVKASLQSRIDAKSLSISSIKARIEAEVAAILKAKQEEADRLAAIEAARLAAIAEAKEAARLAAIEAARLAAEKAAAEEAARLAAEKAAAEEAAKVAAEKAAAEEAARLAAEKAAAEEAAKVAAEKAAAEEAARLAAEKAAAEEAAKVAAEKAAAEKAAQEVAAKLAAEQAKQLADKKAAEEKALQENQAKKEITNPTQLSDTVVKEAPKEVLVAHIQIDKPGVANGGIEFFGTKSAPQVVGEDGKLTPPAPPPGSGLPIPPDAITTSDTFIGQPGGTTFNAPDISVPVELVPLEGAIASVPGAQALNEAFVAMANIGNDMSPVTRKKAKKILVATVVVGQIVAFRRRFGE